MGTSVIDGTLTASEIGRFYRFAAFDVKGIHGVRLHDGTEIHAYPDLNKRIFFVAIPALVALIAVMVMTRDAVPMLAVIGLVIATIGFIASQAAKRQSLRQFEGAHGRPLDAGRRTSPNL